MAGVHICNGIDIRMGLSANIMVGDCCTSPVIVIYRNTMISVVV